MSANKKLTLADCQRIEAEMRRMESDPEVSKRALRLFLQNPMPCGHATANLLTCPDPPYGCVICGTPTEGEHRMSEDIREIIERVAIGIYYDREAIALAAFARSALSRIEELEAENARLRGPRHPFKECECPS